MPPQCSPAIRESRNRDVLRTAVKSPVFYGRFPVQLLPPHEVDLRQHPATRLLAYRMAEPIPVLTWGRAGCPRDAGPARIDVVPWHLVFVGHFRTARLVNSVPLSLTMQAGLPWTRIRALSFRATRAPDRLVSATTSSSVRTKRWLAGSTRSSLRPTRRPRTVSCRRSRYAAISLEFFRFQFKRQNPAGGAGLLPVYLVAGAGFEPAAVRL